MKVTVKYFASIRETVGLSGETIDTGAVTLAELRDELIALGGGRAESLAHGRTVRMALNQTMSNGNAVLSDCAEVAFFPPVTGG
jgi:molybdopterin synthase sulfur carrier subunit